MGRRRLRRFYARDSHGRFSKTAGRGGTYKKKLSTKKKVAIGAAGAVVVTGAVLGGRELYRAGGRKGWEYGRAQGVKAATPKRDKRGRVRKRNPALDHDHKQNPFARGYRPVGPEGRARKPPKIRTAKKRYQQWERRQERLSPRPKDNPRRARAARARTERRVNSANSRRYNQAQTRSQRGGASARRGAANAVVASTIAGTAVSRRRTTGRRKRR